MPEPDEERIAAAACAADAAVFGESGPVRPDLADRLEPRLLGFVELAGTGRG